MPASVEIRLSAIFCAVAAPSRVEPATTSGPVSSRTATSASASSAAARDVGDADDGGAGGAGRLGDGERCRGWCRWRRRRSTTSPAPRPARARSAAAAVGLVLGGAGDGRAATRRRRRRAPGVCAGGDAEGGGDLHARRRAPSAPSCRRRRSRRGRPAAKRRRRPPRPRRRAPAAPGRPAAAAARWLSSSRASTIAGGCAWMPVACACCASVRPTVMVIPPVAADNAKTIPIVQQKSRCSGNSRSMAGFASLLVLLLVLSWREGNRHDAVSRGGRGRHRAAARRSPTRPGACSAAARRPRPTSGPIPRARARTSSPRRGRRWPRRRGGAARRAASRCWASPGANVAGGGGAAGAGRCRSRGRGSRATR